MSEWAEDAVTGAASTDLTGSAHKARQGRAGANECGFCTRGRWHNPRTNQRELCPYCDGSGYVARAGHLDCRECEKAAAEDRTIYAAKRTAEVMKGRTFQRNLYDWLADYHQRGHVDDD